MYKLLPLTSSRESKQFVKKLGTNEAMRNNKYNVIATIPVIAVSSTSYDFMLHSYSSTRFPPLIVLVEGQCSVEC